MPLIIVVCVGKGVNQQRRLLDNNTEALKFSESPDDSWQIGKHAEERAATY